MIGGLEKWMVCVKCVFDICVFFDICGCEGVWWCFFIGDFLFCVYECIQIVDGCGIVLMDLFVCLNGFVICNGKIYLQFVYLVEDVWFFIVVDCYLCGIGLLVLEIYEVDQEQGIFFVEDFGDEGVIDVVCKLIVECYYEVVFCFVEYYQFFIVCELFIDDRLVYQVFVFDKVILFYEVEFLFDWYIFWKCNGVQVIVVECEDYFLIWNLLIDEVLLGEMYFVMCDYYLLNLFWLLECEGFCKIGMIDFQDVIIGFFFYDVVLLVQDVCVIVECLLMDDFMEIYMQVCEVVGFFDCVVFLKNWLIMLVQCVCWLNGFWV